MGFSQREYWSGLPLPPPGDLPDPGMEAVHLMSLRRQLGSLPLAPPGKPISSHRPFPVPTSPWQPQFGSMALPFLYISRKWNHIICD